MEHDAKTSSDKVMRSEDSYYIHNKNHNYSNWSHEPISKDQNYHHWSHEPLPVELSYSVEVTKPLIEPTIGGLGYRKWLTLVGLAFGNFSIGACVSLQAPFFPAEAERKGATAAEYGFVFGVYPVGMFLFAPIFGKLVSYIPPYFLSTFGIFGVGCSSIVFGLLDRTSDEAFIPLAVIVRLLEGVGAVAVKTSSYAIIGTQFPDEVATVFAMLETSLGVGLILGPTVGGFLYQVGGFTTPFAVVGGMLMVDACIIFAVLPREGKNLKKSGAMLKFFMYWPNIVNGLTVFSVFLYLGFFQVSLEPHLRKFNLSPMLVGSVFMISGGVYAISAPIWGRFCDKGVNPRVLVFFGVILALFSETIIGPVGFIPVETQLWMVIVGLALMGLGGSLKLVPTFIICLRETIFRGFPNDITTYGLVSTLYATSQSIGAFLGPTTSGYLLDSWGFRWTLLLLIGIEIFLFLMLCIRPLCVRDSSEKIPILSPQISSGGTVSKSVFEKSYSKSLC